MVTNCGVRVYSEGQLDRKMRNERSKWRLVEEDSPSEQQIRCVRVRFLAQVIRAAKLTPLERRAFILAVNGASVRQVANALGISLQRTTRLMSGLKRKLRCAASDKYHGLHEVYWQEVRRYVYRKPRHVRSL